MAPTKPKPVRRKPSIREQEQRALAKLKAARVRREIQAHGYRRPKPGDVV